MNANRHELEFVKLLDRTSSNQGRVVPLAMELISRMEKIQELMDKNIAKVVAPTRCAVG